jgi:hypothetical protein
VSRGRGFGPPMTLGNMRINGVHAVIATCEACGHKADVNVDALPDNVTVPEAGRRLRCSQCGEKGSTRGLHGIRHQPGPVAACARWGVSGAEVGPEAAIGGYDDRGGTRRGGPRPHPVSVSGR